VTSGNAPFSPIIANVTYRNIFHGAPLTQISETITLYNSNNSYYASSSPANAVGRVKFGKFTSGQKEEIVEQTEGAIELELRSRY
jgi:hypothetical protein